MSDFYSDRAEGHKLEQTLVDALQFRGLNAWQNPAPEDDYEGRCAYDLAFTDLGGNEHTIEAKMDFMAATTGNLCIERASLDHSEAEYFAIAVPYIHILTRQEIEEVYSRGRVKLVGEQKQPASIVSRMVTREIGKSFKDFVIGFTSLN